MQDRTRPSAAFKAALAATRRFGERDAAVAVHEPDADMLLAGMEAGGIDATTTRAVYRAMVGRRSMAFDGEPSSESTADEM